MAVKIVSYSVAGCGIIGVNAKRVIASEGSANRLLTATNDGTLDGPNTFERDALQIRMFFSYHPKLHH